MLFLSETCPCPEFITTASVAQDLKADDLNYETIASGLTKIMSKLIIDTCGYCESYGETKLVYANNSDSEGLVFPVTMTSQRQSVYSKFIPVIRVPGVVIITRKKEISVILTKVTSGSVLQSWPITVLTASIAMLAGIIIWSLVSFL